ncbi:uncharacterized protein BDR25DRAFT_364196 [Lindgomyces ingoldianus]|uniref:Uncharacterized protein n=1 Tax=Lindgomyces ingoldianus TaxID=673940 RepID=A0ACB6RE28_9PLEO|nr:uncharacterized protein BDR25DRAFT_364196 [Lindgomyces ingoldianus]KAF2477401.1 hypothetical protein BDR25DRAFT_364196 [Lindgomyces ingoldianus]
MIRFLLLLLGAAFVTSSAILLVFKKGRRDVFLNRLHFRSRRSSGSNTPPRSLSPGKKQPENIPTPDYSDTFPPSRRFALAEIQSNLPSILGKSQESLAASPSDSRKACLPITTSYLDAETPMFTPCEFSTEEIKALGNFPDYATLSGVPLPRPYPEFNSKKAQPRPYRPFRWTYHQTMSLTKLEPDWWLEIENTYEKRIKQRQELFEKHGEGVLQALPGSELACKELMEMALQFLCARYPHYFRLDKEKMVFYNGILSTESDLKNTHPLQVLLNNVPEDFAITLRDPITGYYSFRAGLICSALGWNVASKIGMQLHEIHKPIPDYKEKMQYFAKKPTDKAIQRGSWGLEVDQPLYMPPGDPHEKHRDVQHADLSISRCHLRVDWQTLRRLPLSGAIVFNFKALFTPVESFRDEPFIPALLLKVLKDGKRSLMEYKNTWHTEHVVIPELEKYAKEQVDSGAVPKNWEPHTLEESPWFPGWEEKWHREQGY